MKRSQAVDLAEHELTIVTARWGKFLSAHEGYAVILEEMDELWETVKRNQKNACPNEMRDEAKQVAAMAIRFMIDCTP